MKRPVDAEIIILLLCALGMAFSGWYLYTSQGDRNAQASGDEQSLGFIRSEGIDVRVRGESELNWNHVSRDANVFENDRVFTGASSTARIQLKSAEEFRVEPNSLIVITDERGQKLFQLRSGSFLAELKKGARLLVQAGERKAEITASSATLRLESRDGGNLKLVVLKGEANLKTPETEAPRVVKANESAVITKEAVVITPFKVALAQPGPGAVLWNSDRAIHFEWSRTGGVPAPGAEDRLEVSTDPLFGHDVVDARASERGFDAKLAAGVYFWRVTPPGATTAESPTSSFALYDLKVPTPLGPERLEVKFNSAGQAEGAVAFNWEDPSRSVDYLLEISDSREFRSLVTSQVGATTEMRVNQLRHGSFYWRVTSRHPGRADLTSAPRALTLVGEVPPAPEINPEPARPTEKPATVVTVVVAPPPPAVPTLPLSLPPQSLPKPPASAPPKARPPLSPPPSPPRRPASDLLKFVLAPPTFMPPKPFVDDNLTTFFGGRENLRSSLQVADQRSAASVVIAGVRARKWLGQSGVDVSGSGGQGAGASYADLNALYLYRLRPFADVAPWQIISFAGARAHFSDRASLFSRRYQVLVAGAEVLVPVRDALVLGASANFGYGAGGTRVYETGVKMKYRLDPSWSFGVDYGVRLVDVKSTAFAPNGALPYREGYDRLRFSLNFAF